MCISQLTARDGSQRRMYTKLRTVLFSSVSTSNCRPSRAFAADFKPTTRRRQRGWRILLWRARLSCRKL
jgi:hypothetical protein